MSDNKVYEKLLRVRQSENLSIKPCRWLKQEIELRDGTVIPFQLRNYQLQLVFHALMMRRFVIGDDCGLGKCCTYDHLVNTTAGLVRIGEMHDWAGMQPETFAPISQPWEVLVGGEALPVKNFYYGGTKPTIKVRTLHGYEVEGTQVHPLLVKRKDGGHQWVESRNLRVGDYLCIERNRGVVGDQSFPAEEPELCPDVKNNGGKNPQIDYQHHHQHDDVGKVTPSFAGHYGRSYDFLHDKDAVVPRCILRSTRASNIAFLKGIFESMAPDHPILGGHPTAASSGCGGGDIEVLTASEDLGRHLQVMLLRFGVVSRRYKKRITPYGYHNKGVWALTVTGADNIRALHDALLMGAAPLLSQRGVDGGDTQYFYDPIVSLEAGAGAEVFDIEVDDPRHCFVANGVVNHNTLETIATLCYIWEKEPDIIPIIVTNTSAMHQWGGEFDKFTNGVGWVVAEGGPEKRYKIYDEFFQDWDPDNPRVLILNYHRLKRDHRHIKEHLEGRRYLLAYDEITAVKSTDSQAHKICRQLADNAERVYGLTATLIKNNLEEGFGIYKVVLPELFHTKKGFYRDYCVTKKQEIRVGGKRRKIEILVGHSKEHIRKFREKIDPYYLGRAKHVVAKELPVLTTKDIITRVTADQWDQYEDALAGLLTVNLGTEDEEEKEVTKLTQLIYTQQIVNSPHLIGNDGPSGKEDFLLDMLKEDLFGEKVIIFTRFKEMVNRLQDLLEKDGYGLGISKQRDGSWEPADEGLEGKGFVRITGDENADMRDAARRAFTEGGNTNLIFITMAGAEAINLQTARVMVFYDLPWSAGDYLQCLDSKTEILTPKGWRGVGQVNKGDLVAGFDNETSEIKWTPAKSVVMRHKAPGEKMFELKSPQINTRITGGHRMLFRRKTYRNKKAVWPSEWGFETAEEMSQEKSHFQVPVSGLQKSKGVPLTDSELEFLGWYLSDGCLNVKISQLVITQANHQPHIHDLRECLKSCDLDWSEYHKKPNGFPNGKPQTIFSIPKGTEGGSRARKGWIKLESYLDKNLSNLLEDITRDQLKHLLKGIHYGDGQKQPKNVNWTQGSYHIYTANKIFAERLQSLCVRRGFRCNISTVSARPEKNQKEGFILHIKDQTYVSLCGNEKVNRPRMKTSKNIKDEEVWCVENEMGTLITRRGGKVLIMGNCIGRMIRIGSAHQRVYAMHMLAEGPGGEKTIDHYVLATLQKKMGWIEGTLGQRLVSDDGTGEDAEDMIMGIGNDTDDIFAGLLQSARSIVGSSSSPSGKSGR